MRCAARADERADRDFRTASGPAPSTFATVASSPIGGHDDDVAGVACARRRRARRLAGSRRYARPHQRSRAAPTGRASRPPRGRRRPAASRPLVDMPLNSIPPTTTVAGLEAKRRAAAGRCAVDVAFWGGVVPGNRDALEPLARRRCPRIQVLPEPFGRRRVLARERRRPARGHAGAGRSRSAAAGPRRMAGVAARSVGRSGGEPARIQDLARQPAARPASRPRSTR